MFCAPLYFDDSLSIVKPPAAMDGDADCHGARASRFRRLVTAFGRVGHVLCLVVSPAATVSASAIRRACLPRFRRAIRERVKRFVQNRIRPSLGGVLPIRGIVGKERTGAHQTPGSAAETRKAKSAMRHRRELRSGEISQGRGYRVEQRAKNQRLHSCKIYLDLGLGALRLSSGSVQARPERHRSIKSPRVTARLQSPSGWPGVAGITFRRRLITGCESRTPCPSPGSIVHRSTSPARKKGCPRQRSIRSWQR